MSREPNKREVFAMFFWHDEYAVQALGAIGFYRRLTDFQKRTVEECLLRLNIAPGRWPTEGVR